MGASQILFEARPWQCHLHQRLFPFSYFFPIFWHCSCQMLHPWPSCSAELLTACPGALLSPSSQKKESSPTWKVRPSCSNSLCSRQKGHQCSTTPRASASHHSCCQQLIPRVFFVLLVRREGSGCSSSSAIFHYPLYFPLSMEFHVPMTARAEVEWVISSSRAFPTFVHSQIHTTDPGDTWHCWSLLSPSLPRQQGMNALHGWEGWEVTAVLWITPWECPWLLESPIFLPIPNL